MHARVTTAAPDGAPEVVLLHGLGVSSRYMLPLARELAPHFRALAPDLPGFGHSDHPPAALDVPGLADALLAWIDAAGLIAPVLVADSVGCQVPHGDAAAGRHAARRRLPAEVAGYPAR